MSNQMVTHNRFRKLATVMYVLSFIVMALFGVAAIAILISGIVILMIPVEELIGIISSLSLNTAIEAEGLSFIVTEDILSYVNPDKTMMALVIFVSLLSVLVMLFIVILVNKWLKNLRHGQILTDENSKYIEYIGYSFVLFAVMEMIQNFTISLFVNNSVDFSKVPADVIEFFGIENSAVNIDINLVPVFAGILIWMIAKSLKYGAFLQDEYDQTV